MLALGAASCDAPGRSCCRSGPIRLLEVDEDLRSVEHLRLVLRGYAPSATMNLLGLPSVVVPTGVSDGLPTGVQLVPAWHRDDLCLAAAETVERGLGTLSDALARPLSA